MQLWCEMLKQSCFSSLHRCICMRRFAYNESWLHANESTWWCRLHKANSCCSQCSASSRGGEVTRIKWFCLQIAVRFYKCQFAKTDIYNFLIDGSLYSQMDYKLHRSICKSLYTQKRYPIYMLCFILWQANVLMVLKMNNKELYPETGMYNGDCLATFTAVFNSWMLLIGYIYCTWITV